MVEQYHISVTNSFDAENPEDAIMQMICWLEESARHAGYRWLVESSNGTGDWGGFVDADKIDADKIVLD